MNKRNLDARLITEAMARMGAPAAEPVLVTRMRELGRVGFTLQMADAWPDLIAALEDAREFLRPHEDVRDGDYGVPAPNVAMELAMEIERVLTKAGVR